MSATIWNMHRDLNEALKLLERHRASDPSIHEFLTLRERRVAAAQQKRREDEEAAQERKEAAKKRAQRFEQAPRHERGVDWGATGDVLIRSPKARLIWRRGGSYFAGIGQRGYAPAQLQIVFADRRDQSLSRSEEKARLGAKLLERHRAAIDEVFGRGATDSALSLEGTVVLK